MKLADLHEHDMPSSSVGSLAHVAKAVLLAGLALGGFWAGLSAAPDNAIEVRAAVRAELAPMHSQLARLTGQIDGMNRRLGRVEGLLSVTRGAP